MMEAPRDNPVVACISGMDFMNRFDWLFDTEFFFLCLIETVFSGNIELHSLIDCKVEMLCQRWNVFVKQNL